MRIAWPIEGRTVRSGCGLCLLLFAAGCSGEPSLTPADRAEFRRHLLQGLEQARDGLFESAEAEFRRCAAIDPGNTDLEFHRARLALRGDVRARSEAIDRLEALAAATPGSIRAARILWDQLNESGREAEAVRWRDRILQAYGDLGTLELSEAHLLLGRDRPPEGLIRKPIQEIRAAVESGTPTAGDRFAVAVWRLGGGMALPYDPEPAMAELETLFRDYPDLSALRIRVAKHLRMTRYPRRGTDERTATDSQWSLDVAQLQYERALDLLSPASPLARVALEGLATLALEMGDYDDAERKFDLVLEHPTISDRDRIQVLWLRGVASYRKGDYQRAIDAGSRAIALRPEIRVLWSLRLAREAAGDRGKPLFALRPDAENPDNPTGMAFRDVAADLGVDKTDGAGPSAWGDYDDDGDFDLFVAGCDTFSILYRNDGDRFTDVSREAGLAQIDPAWSSSFVDYDNDGDPDLYLARNGWNGPGDNSLYENQGDGTFRDVTGRAGLGDPGSTFVHLWTDYDRDGFLDLFVANGVRTDGSVNRLYRNRGDGTFADVTRAAGLLEPTGTQTIGAAVGDYDRDGWPDLFLNGYRLERNRLYRNRGDGTFEEVAERAGVRGPPKKAQGYVAFFFDYNNDAWPDILLTKLADWSRTLIGMSAWYLEQPAATREELAALGPELYRNNGDGTFTDASREAGFVYPHGVMGAGIADLDNDGFLDVYLGTGAPPLERLEPNIFYRNTGDGRFVDLTWKVGLGHLGKGHGITFADYDRDGLLDIYSPQGGFVHGDLWPNALYRNETRVRYHWIGFRLRGVRSNRDGVGTQLTVRAGPLTLYREARTGGGFGVTDEPVVHFGLGENARADEVRVRWPSGSEQSFRDLEADRVFFLREGGEPSMRGPGNHPGK